MVESEKMAIGGQFIVKHVTAATNYCGNGFGTKVYPWNNFLRDK
jgi:hypothetical protein